MLVKDLIDALQRLPQDAKAYRDGGDYQDDWREVKSASAGQVWEFKGVFLE